MLLGSTTNIHATQPNFLASTASSALGQGLKEHVKHIWLMYQEQEAGFLLEFMGFRLGSVDPR